MILDDLSFKVVVCRARSKPSFDTRFFRRFLLSEILKAGTEERLPFLGFCF